MGNEVRVLITATDQASAKLSGVQKASLGLTAGFAAVGVASVKMAMDFEHGMDQVGAVANASEKDVASLRKEALKIGADTSKSAGEAAKAMEELAAGGRSVAQIMGGEARAAVSLSEAGNYDLAASAELVAQTMDAWKDSQLSTNDVVNRLAGAANASKFGVEDMAGAIGQAGGVAAAMGVSFQDMTTAVAMTASSFSSGSDAGTSFKTFLLGLDGTTEKAKGTIKEYGLEFRNANGELKPMAEITEELRTKVGTLGEAQQVAALKTIFGNDAYRTAAGLMNSTGQEFAAMSDKMGSTNAADVAKQRMTNLSGEVEKLKGSLETAGIQLGTKAIPLLTDLAAGAGKAVNAFGELPSSTQNIVLLGGAAAAALPGLIGLTDKATAAVSKMAAEFKAGKLSASSMALGVTGVAIALDLILQKTTGAGLADRIFGDVAKMEGGKKALADWNATLLAAGPNADKLALATEKFGKLAAEAGGPTGKLKEEVDGLGNVMLGSDGRMFGFATSVSKSVDETKRMQAETALLGQAMLDAGADSFSLKQVYDQLPAALKKTFDETTNVNAAYAINQDAAEMSRINNLYLADSVAKVADDTPKAVSAIEDWTAKVGEAEDGTKDFTAAIEALQNSFATTNPTVIALNAQHAKLNEELEDLKDKGDAATASDKARIQQIEGQLLPAIDKEIKHYADNQKAMEGMSGAVEKMMGTSGYGALLDVMQRLKVPQEDQVAVTGKIADAYSALARNDIPTAIRAFDDMKKGLSPEVWAPIAEAVGPELSRKIKEGMSGPEKDAAVAAAEKLGIDIADGVSQGLSSAANRIVATGRGIIIDAIGEMKAAAQTQSPSKLTYKIGLDIAKGAEIGMLDGAPAASEAAAGLARDVFTSFSGTLKDLYADAPDYVKKFSPAAGGDKAAAGTPADYMTQYQGGGQTGYLGGGVGPNGTVWDAEANAYVMPWEKGNNLTGRIKDWQDSDSYGQVGAPSSQTIILQLDGAEVARVVNLANARAG